MFGFGELRRVHRFLHGVLSAGDLVKRSSATQNHTAGTDDVAVACRRSKNSAIFAWFQSPLCDGFDHRRGSCDSGTFDLDKVITLAQKSPPIHA